MLVVSSLVINNQRMHEIGVDFCETGASLILVEHKVCDSRNKLIILM